MKTIIFNYSSIILVALQVNFASKKKKQILENLLRLSIGILRKSSFSKCLSGSKFIYYRETCIWLSHLKRKIIMDEGYFLKIFIFKLLRIKSNFPLITTDFFQWAVALMIFYLFIKGIIARSLPYFVFAPIYLLGGLVNFLIFLHLFVVKLYSVVIPEPIYQQYQSFSTYQ